MYGNGIFKIPMLLPAKTTWQKMFFCSASPNYRITLAFSIVNGKPWMPG
jgi:hypothetical protein